MFFWVDLGNLIRRQIHDGRNNIYTFEKDEKKHTLIPLKDEDATEEVSLKVPIVTGKEFLHQIRNKEVRFALVGKPRIVPTSTKLTDLLIEIQDLLDEFIDIVVDDLPNE